MAAVRFGIAGWSYDDWKGVVYPRGCKDTLRYCAQFVDCIEINSSFYSIPAARTCESWVRRTAELPLFFTAKLARVFTHDLALDAHNVERTRQGFAPLVEAGVLRLLLAQFSYRFIAAPEHRVHLARLVEAFAPIAPLAVEVRHRSWQMDDALEWLRALDVSVVHLDYPGSRSGFGLRSTGLFGHRDTAYFRLHGRNTKAWFRQDAGRDEVYDYDYSAQEVVQVAERVDGVASKARETVVIANNHFHGQGMKAALELMACYQHRKVRVPDALLRAFPALAAIARGGQRGLF